MCENWELWLWVNTVHWFDASCSGTSVNNTITLISPVLTVPGLHFCRWQYVRNSANFRTVFSESQNTNPLMPSSKHMLTQNDNSRSLKVICFGVSEKPLRGYIVQYNNILAWHAKVRKNSEWKKPFSMTPHLFDAPYPANPLEYPHKSYLATN